MRRFLLLLAPVALVGCAAGPDYHAPPPPPSATGAFQTSVPDTSTAAPDDNWWRLYDDPALDRLVLRALAANTDLRVARANLLRAQSVLREIRSARMPGGDLSAGANYGDEGGNRGEQGGPAQWSYNGAVNLNWELDLFGRIGRAIEAGRADAQSVEAARDSVAVTVAAETVRAYVDACALAESIAVASESVSIAEKQFTIQQARERAGAVSRLDTERSATTLANARSLVPMIEGRRQAALFELAALIGASPSEVPETARNCKRAPAPVAALPIGDGQALLARRPDVREAERRLAADTARIGVATADLYPRISLGGSGNFFRNDSVRGSDSFTFSFGPLISWSFPDIVAGRARIDQADAQAQASLAAFDGAVLTALKETEQALSFYAAEAQRNARLKEASTHADAAFRLADQRYRAGSIAFLELLDTQRALLEARGAFANSSQELGSRRITLFKALGGGWQSATTPAPPA